MIPCLFCALSKKLKSLKSERKELGHKGPRGSEDCVDKMPFALKVLMKPRLKCPTNKRITSGCLYASSGVVRSLSLVLSSVFKWHEVEKEKRLACVCCWLSCLFSLLLWCLQSHVFLHVFLSLL